MGHPEPNPEVIARAWELHIEGRSLRFIAEKLRQEKLVETISHETVRTYVKLGRAAEAWMTPDEPSDLPHLRARYMAFLDYLMAAGVDRLAPSGGGTYEQVAPVILRVAAEQGKLLGLYAPSRVALEGSVLAPAPDPRTAAILAAMAPDIERAREQATATGEALLSGDEESP